MLDTVFPSLTLGAGNLIIPVTINLHCITCVSQYSIKLYKLSYGNTKIQNKQILWPLVREQTIPIERPPLVDEI
jgi:hypothetical protein